jgi:hypothetical protein
MVAGLVTSLPWAAVFVTCAGAIIPSPPRR